MGTNYYVLLENEYYDINRPLSMKTEPKFLQVHIGKSSGGWCFSLHIPTQYDFDSTPYNPTINTLDDWKEFLKDKIIIDEYLEEVSEEGLYDTIENRSWDRRGMSFNEWVDEMERLNNDSSSYMYSRRPFNRGEYIEGPNKLRRHPIDGSHCIGWGEGTWDYIRGEFS